MRPASGVILSAQSLAAVDRIAEVYSGVGSMPADSASGEGALRELLATSSVDSSDRVDVMPYNKELVSLPDLGSRPVDICAALPVADRVWLQGSGSLMLRDAAEAA